MSNDSSTSEEEMSDVTDSEDVSIFSEPEEEMEIDNINVNSYVSIKFSPKKSTKFYVGKVTEITTDEYIISFLRRHGNKFSYPDVPDCAAVSKEDIVLHLPQPKTAGGPAELQAFSIFPLICQLTMYLML